MLSFTLNWSIHSQLKPPFDQGGPRDSQNNIAYGCCLPEVEGKSVKTSLMLDLGDVSLNCL